MTDKVNVRKHTRRRTGRAAEFAAKMGYGSDVRVASYPRRRPESDAEIIRKAKMATRVVERAEADLSYKEDNPFGYRLVIKEARRKAENQYMRLAKRGYNPDGKKIGRGAR